MDYQLNDLPETRAPKTGLISGFLSVLWIESAVFTGSKKRIVFRFYTEPPDLFTLHGWENDNDEFPEDPDIKLNMGPVSGIAYGNKTYFGNLVLPRDARKAINKLIKEEGFTYVLFKPDDPFHPHPSIPVGQITYDIELTNDQPVPFQTIATSKPTGVSLNPSPPRNPG